MQDSQKFGFVGKDSAVFRFSAAGPVAICLSGLCPTCTRHDTLATRKADIVPNVTLRLHVGHAASARKQS